MKGLGSGDDGESGGGGGGVGGDGDGIGSGSVAGIGGRFGRDYPMVEGCLVIRGNSYE